MAPLVWDGHGCMGRARRRAFAVRSRTSKSGARSFYFPPDLIRRHHPRQRRRLPRRIPHLRTEPLLVVVLLPNDLLPEKPPVLLANRLPMISRAPRWLRVADREVERLCARRPALCSPRSPLQGT